MSTILLVEDNPHIMKINAEALSMYGYEILQAATARECRQALRWHPVDLVVLETSCCPTATAWSCAGS